MQVLGEEAGQLPWRGARLMIKQYRYGVAEHLSDQTVAQVPQDTGPHPIGVIALDELAEDVMKAMCESCGTRAARTCQSRSLIAHTLAACRVKVVR